MDYPPSSALGKFAKVIILETRFQTELQNYVRQQIRPGKDPSREIHEYIEEWRGVLGQIREVRKGLGEEIFGEESEDYRDRLKKLLLTPRVNKTAHEKQREGYQDLCAEIQERFPLTSRATE